MTSKETWKLKKNENNIKIYTKDLDNSKIKAYKATTTLNHSITKIKTLLMDPDKFTKWVDRNSYTKSFEPGENYVFYHSIFTAPFPVQDRDVVIKAEYKKTENGAIIEHTSAYDKKPVLENTIRVKDTYGKWELIKVSDNQTKIIYLGYSDPSGSIPAWLINSFLIDGPFNSISNLNTILNK